MVKLRDNIEEQFPFISVLNYGDEEYIGIIINQDQYVTSFYDLEAIKTTGERSLFLALGEVWWWKVIDKFPLIFFLEKI